MKAGKDQAISNRLVVLTLDMAETDGKLAELRYLPEDLLGDEVNAPMLWPKVNLGLEPAGADLDATVRGGHGRAVANVAKVDERGRKKKSEAASPGHADRRRNNVGELLQMADAKSHLVMVTDNSSRAPRSDPPNARAAKQG